MSAPTGDGFDIGALAPIRIERSAQPTGQLYLALSTKTGSPFLSKAARAKFPRDATVEYLGSDRMPHVLAIRATPKGTKYAVPLPKTGNLRKQIDTMLRTRGWQDGHHAAEWRDGALVVWRTEQEQTG